MRVDAEEHVRRASRVSRHGVGDAALVGEVRRAIAEKVRGRVGASERHEEAIEALLEQRGKRALGDPRVRVGGQRRQQLDPLFGRQGSAAGAYGEFSLRPGFAGEDLLAQLRVNFVPLAFSSDPFG
jgi:hypothetical protein